MNIKTKIQDKLRNWGITQKLHSMDNEISEDLKQYFDKSYIQFQLGSPHMHQRNAAERSLRTFKNHFVSALCTVYPYFYFYFWELFLPRFTMTLNMLWRSKLNLELSEYE